MKAAMLLIALPLLGAQDGGVMKGTRLTESRMPACPA